ncbi:MAG: two-component system sensor histidine kinase CreC [Massilia sp.]
MKIGLRILLGYFLVVGLAAWFLLNVFVEQVKPGVRATMEDTLVDTANLLAVMVAADVRDGKLANSPMLAKIEDFTQRQVDVKISGLTKQTLDYRVYITDVTGKVLFDSEHKATGKDYSRWNDVYTTLRGGYGARSTRSDPDDEASTVMHVAAPIKDGDTIIGVLTVAKPNATVQPFVERSRQNILRRGALLLVLSLLVGLAFAFWINRMLRKLLDYIAKVEAGDKAPLPALGKNEIGTLGRALEAMRHKLEGKEYAEQLMHTMAHELKSPIAAIQGAAELLREEMPVEDRRHFIATILAQNTRQKQLIDKLLALVRVETQQRLHAPERIGARALLADVHDDYRARLDARGLRLEITADDLSLLGDALLLRQALGNLVDNAIEFSPDGGRIALTLAIEKEMVVISVCDEGGGIPDYASGRLFERFYSLPRANGARSNGLGLPFVREVMALHKGSAEVVNADGGGACAVLRLPAA